METRRARLAGEAVRGYEGRPDRCPRITFTYLSALESPLNAAVQTSERIASDPVLSGERDTALRGLTLLFRLIVAGDESSTEVTDQVGGASKCILLLLYLLTTHVHGQNLVSPFSFFQFLT